MASHDSSLPPLARESLTPREWDILALLAQDLPDSEIADRLVITVNTVKWYNRRIYAKLGVKTRRQAADYARVHSLLVDRRAWQALPEQTTPFIGRRDELEQLTDLLRQGPSRLVTILAPGGMGKTRLALAAAEACASQFSDGVYFAQLGALASADQLLPAIADATGFQLTSDRRTPRQQVFNFLADKESLLLLDNFEHVVEGATLLADLLEASSRVRLLVTSRERLDLSCETLFTLSGMACPESPQVENGPEYSAVELFIECGRRLAPSKTLADMPSIIQICQLTQGMPLAIELAGAWLVALSPAEIAAELARGLDFLQTTMRDIPPRQRSVRVVCESAWQRLSANEQNVFQRLAVFRGGFTREAAQAVCAAQADTLLSLANKALIARNQNRNRYDVHELLRQFAEEQLGQVREIEATRRRHADHFLAFMSTRLPTLQNRHQPSVLDEIEADFDNIREALHYALDNDLTANFMPAAECMRLFFEARVHLSSAVHHPGLPYTSFRLFFEARAHFSADAATFFSKALAKAHTPTLEVTLREGLGDALQVAAAYDQARQEFERAYRLLLPDAVVLRARLLRKVALSLDAQNQLEDALNILAEAAATLTRTHHRDPAWWQEWIATQNAMVSAYFFLGNLVAIRQRSDSLRTAVERYGTPAQRFDFFVSANVIELLQTSFAALGNAMEYADLGLAAAHETGGLLQVALGHIRIGITRIVGEEWALAEDELLFGLEIADRIGNALTQTVCSTFLAYICRRRGQVAATDWWAKRTHTTAVDTGIDLYVAAAKANLAWVAWRTDNVRQAASLAGEALRIWQEISPKYPVQLQATWITLGVALKEERLDDAIGYARQILAPPQVPPPDSIAQLLDAAIRAWDEGEMAGCRASLSEVSILAGFFGFL